MPAVNTQTLLLLRQPSGKHALKGVHMHAYSRSRLWNDLLAWWRDRTSTVRSPDHAKEHSKFQDDIRREIAHRHYVPHRLLVWVHRAFGSHSKVWSWSLDSSATRIGRASDCRRGRVKKKKKRRRVKRSMLLNWLGHVGQLPSFPLCETFPQIP